MRSATSFLSMRVHGVPGPAAKDVERRLRRTVKKNTKLVFIVDEWGQDFSDGIAKERGADEFEKTARGYLSMAKQDPNRDQSIQSARNMRSLIGEKLWSTLLN